MFSSLSCYMSEYVLRCIFVFFFKQKTAYEMRISDWSSDVCSSDLIAGRDWNGRCPAKPAQCARLLQLAADERSGGLYPVHVGPDHGQRRGHGRIDRGVPAQLHGGIPSVHRPCPSGASQGCLMVATGDRPMEQRAESADRPNPTRR